MGKIGGGHNKGKPSPSTLAKVAAQDALRAAIEADMQELYDAWKATAIGHFVRVKTATGETKVYKRSPNASAIKDMFERAFGRPKQPIEGSITVMDLSESAQAILDELNNAITDEETGEDETSEDASDMVRPARKSFTRSAKRMGPQIAKR